MTEQREMTLLEATLAGDERAEILAMLRINAAAIEDCDSKRDMPALMRKQMELRDRLKDLDHATGNDEVGHASDESDEGFDSSDV